MRIEAVELRQLEVPMIEPLAAAYGTTSFRQTILVHVSTDVGEGWGECVALNEPMYSPDWSNGEWVVLQEVFAPSVLNAGEFDPYNFFDILARFKHHHTAKAALEMAVLDAQLRHEGLSFAQYLGATRTAVTASVVVGLVDGDALINSVAHQLDKGYKELKLKVKPGSDVERIKLVMDNFPGLAVRIDANGSYDWDDAEHRAAIEKIDDLGLVLFEQPFAPDRAKPLQEYRSRHRTPVALDESINSWNKALTVLEMQLADVLTVKPGMLGSYLTGRRLQVLAKEFGVRTMLGGMVDCAPSRAANLALAACEDSELSPAEVAPDGRWFDERLNRESVDLIDGVIAVPTALGVVGELDWTVMDRLTRRFHVSRVSLKT